LARLDRFTAEYDLPFQDAVVLTLERPIADLFEDAVREVSTSDAYRMTANWIVNDIMGLARARDLPLDVLPMSAAQIADLVRLVRSGAITARAAKDLLPRLEDGEMPSDAAKRLDVLAVSDEGDLALAAAEAIRRQPAAVADYRGGKKAAIGRLMGETMKLTGGRARPDSVRQSLIAILEETPPG
jgi:aspartyl-tRNA(Asn)/glutamyl-tRNA(Gln) amidotransferase subunit B